MTRESFPLETASLKPSVICCLHSSVIETESSSAEVSDPVLCCVPNSCSSSVEDQDSWECCVCVLEFSVVVVLRSASRDVVLGIACFAELEQQ